MTMTLLATDVDGRKIKSGVFNRGSSPPFKSFPVRTGPGRGRGRPTNWRCDFFRCEIWRLRKALCFRSSNQNGRDPSLHPVERLPRWVVASSASIPRGNGCHHRLGLPVLEPVWATVKSGCCGRCDLRILWVTLSFLLMYSAASRAHAYVLIIGDINFNYLPETKIMWVIQMFYLFLL